LGNIPLRIVKIHIYIYSKENILKQFNSVWKYKWKPNKCKIRLVRERNKKRPKNKCGN
jgi:hypothetical protein